MNQSAVDARYSGKGHHCVVSMHTRLPARDKFQDRVCLCIPKQIRVQFCKSQGGAGGTRAGGMRCYNCGEMGHRASECPGAQNQIRSGPGNAFSAMMQSDLLFGGGKLTSMRSVEEPCMRCGKRGHRTIECPYRLQEV